MPALFPLVVAGVGAVVVGKWLVNEAKRVNALLHPEEPPRAPAAQSDGKRLRRDRQGVYRPE